MSSSDEISSIRINNADMKDSLTTANDFNKYFPSVGENISSTNGIIMTQYNALKKHFLANFTSINLVPTIHLEGGKKKEIIIISYYIM
jgi:hypothetical protein